LEQLGDPVGKRRGSAGESIQIDDEFGWLVRARRCTQRAQFTRREVESDVRAQVDRLAEGVGTKREENRRFGVGGGGEGELFEETNCLEKFETVGLRVKPLPD
jgi:hypothetical protein